MPDKNISTSTLLQRLFKTANIACFIKHYDKQMTCISFDAYITDLCAEKNIKPERVIIKAGIERTYGHQLFSGRRKPSRDKVIQIAFGFGMNFDQTQELLKVARKSTLYPKIKRDAVIIYALIHALGVCAVQATLQDLELPLLGKEFGYG